MILELMPCRACDPILKLVNSAVTNASNNMDLKETSLLVSKAEVMRVLLGKKLDLKLEEEFILYKKVHLPYNCYIERYIFVIMKDLQLNF